MSAVHDVTVGVDTSFARKLSITNGQIVLATRQGDKLVPVGLFDKLQSLNVEADDVDLAKVDALVNLLFNQAAAPKPGEKVIVVAAPPQVTSGTATLKINVSRSGNSTTANVTEALVHNLAIKSGNNPARRGRTMSTRKCRPSWILGRMRPADARDGSTGHVVDYMRCRSIPASARPWD